MQVHLYYTPYSALQCITMVNFRAPTFEKSRTFSYRYIHQNVRQYNNNRTAVINVSLES